MAHAPLRSSVLLLSSASFLLLILRAGRSLRGHVPGVVRSLIRGQRQRGRVQGFALSAGTGAFKEGAQRGSAWFAPHNRDFQIQGPENALVHRHVAPVSPCQARLVAAAVEKEAWGGVQTAATAFLRAEGVQWLRIDVGEKC